jgi:hypothetical protein
VESALRGLPKNVANALRATVAGERQSTALSPEELTRLGKVIAGWGVPVGRSMLGLGMGPMMATAVSQMAVVGQPPPEKEPAPTKAPQVSDSLMEHLGLGPDKAARIEAIVHWPIGFTRADMVEWGLLSEEESRVVWDHIVREYGLYTTGTLYAAP